MVEKDPQLIRELMKDDLSIKDSDKAGGPMEYRGSDAMAMPEKKAEYFDWYNLEGEDLEKWIMSTPTKEVEDILLHMPPESVPSISNQEMIQKKADVVALLMEKERKYDPDDVTTFLDLPEKVESIWSPGVKTLANIIGIRIETADRLKGVELGDILKLADKATRILNNVNAALKEGKIDSEHYSEILHNFKEFLDEVADYISDEQKEGGIEAAQADEAIAKLAKIKSDVIIAYSKRDESVDKELPATRVFPGKK